VSPRTPVTLSWATFCDAADEAGRSRRYGGIHFEDGDLEGRALGRKVAAVVWEKAQRHLRGTIESVAGETLHPELRLPGTHGVSHLDLAATPNPSRGGAVAIRFSLSQPAAAALRVHDVRGRTVAELASGRFAGGTHTASWRAEAPAGLYFLQLESRGETHTQRLVVLD
jgi:hypothetical protein